MEHPVNSKQKFEKNLSPVNVLSLAVGCMIGWGAFMLPGETFLPKAGPAGACIAMAIAAGIMVIAACNYSFMMQRFPVTGGAFTYTREAFGIHHSFICSWFLSLSYLAIVPLNGTALALICRVLFPRALQFGFHYTVAGYDIYLGEVLLASLVLIFFGFLSVKGVKFAGQFENGLVAALLIGIAVLTIACFLPGPADTQNLRPAFSPSTPALAGILGIVAVAPWAFAGYETIPQAVEEFNFSVNKTRMLMIASILTGGTIYILLNVITAMTIPPQYDNWAAYLNEAPSLAGLESMPTFHAARMLLGNVGLLFLGLAVLAAILSSIIGFYMATSRLLYSMSDSGLLPGWFGVISVKSKTPANAILFTMLASLGLLPFGRTALNWIVNMSSVGASIGALYTSLAAFKYAKAERKTSVMITAVLGTCSSIAFIALLLIPIPGSNASLSKASYVCLLVWVILGAVFHGYSCRKGKTKGK